MIGLLIWHEKLSLVNYFEMTIIIAGVILLNIPATEEKIADSVSNKITLKLKDINLRVNRTFI